MSEALARPQTARVWYPTLERLYHSCSVRHGPAAAQDHGTQFQGMAARKTGRYIWTSDALAADSADWRRGNDSGYGYGSLSAEF